MRCGDLSQNFVLQRPKRGGPGLVVSPPVPGLQAISKDAMGAGSMTGKHRRFPYEVMLVSVFSARKEFACAHR